MIDELKFKDLLLDSKDVSALKEYCEALKNEPSINVVSINLYGSATRADFRPGKSDLNILVVAEKLDLPILKNLRETVLQGRRYRIAPFFITESILRSSTDVFPIKFLSIQESYILFMGRDILGELEISRRHLRLRCEQELKNLLLRLRRHYLITGGHRMAEELSSVIVGYLETIRVVISLCNGSLPTHENVINAVASRLNFKPEVLEKIKGLANSSEVVSETEVEMLYSEFMDIVQLSSNLAYQLIIE